jgi:anti-sigma factor RsiW
MCPDPQLLSIYVDGELPSPWDEKMDAHLKECSVCREKVETFKQLRELINKDSSAKKITEEELLKSKEKIWRRIEEKRRFAAVPTQYPRIWQRRISIPLPMAAAAAIIIALIIIFFSRTGQILNNGFAGKKPNPDEKSSFIFGAEEEIPGMIPAATDLNGVLQYLNADGSNIIILQLPESKNFSRSGEPAIIRAADYSRRHP